MDKNSQQLIGERSQNDRGEEIYSFYLRRTIKQNKGLTGDKVQGFGLKAGKGYQINNHLEIFLLDNTAAKTLTLCFDNPHSSVRVDYDLEPHPKLANFYLVNQVKEELLQALIENNFTCNFSITGRNYCKTRDW